MNLAQLDYRIVQRTMLRLIQRSLHNAIERRFMRILFTQNVWMAMWMAYEEPSTLNLVQVPCNTENLLKESHGASTAF